MGQVHAHCIRRSEHPHYKSRMVLDALSSSFPCHHPHSQHERQALCVFGSLPTNFRPQLQQFYEEHHLEERR